MFRKITIALSLTAALALTGVWLWGFFVGIDRDALQAHVNACAGKPQPEWDLASSTIEDYLASSTDEQSECSLAKIQLEMADGSGVVPTGFPVRIRNVWVSFARIGFAKRNPLARRLLGSGDFYVTLQVPERNEVSKPVKRDSWGGSILTFAHSTWRGHFSGTISHEYALRFHASVPVALLLTYPGYVLLFLPMHRQRRRKRGLCEKCAYKLTGLPEPRCPECGTAFASKHPINCHDVPPA